MDLVGVEDGSFNNFRRNKKNLAFLCCVEMKNEMIWDVRLSTIEVDGFDATDKLLKMLEGLDAEAVILGGITFAGFNMIDPSIVFEATGMPVIVYSGRRPDDRSMRSALRKHFGDWERRWRLVEGLGGVHVTSPRPGEPPVFFEVVGGSVGWAEEVLRSSALVCRIPEPVRVAGLVARGVS